MDKKIFLFLIFIFSCQLSVASCQLFAEDKIIAVVNNDIITRKDLNDFLNFMRVQLSAEYKGQELESRIQSMKLNLLDKLIEDRLILQEAKNEKITITPERIKSKIEEMKIRAGSNMEFQHALKMQGLVQADLEMRFREQLLMYYIIEIKIKNKIVVTPIEVTEFYNNNLKEFIVPPERYLTMAVFENEDLAKAFSYDLISGQKLEDLAVRYPFSLDKLKAAKEGELRKEIEDVVFKLAVKEASLPVKIDNKYYVFRLDEVLPPRQKPLSEVRDVLNSYLFNRKMEEELTKWVKELKNKAYIKINSE